VPFFAPTMAMPSELIDLGLDCVGCVAGPSGTVVVIGTAHTPCKSEAEVREVISRLKPDAVILELDQERLDLLLEGRGGLGGGYGDEFAAAARAAEEAGVPVVLGDARIRDIRNQLLRVWRPDAARLLRAARLAAPWTPATASEGVIRVDVLRAFVDDPAKLKPLTGATVWTAALLAASALARPAEALPPLPSSAVLDGAETAVALLLLLLLTRVLDVLLISRDELLATNTLRALELSAAVREGRLLRRQFTFSTLAGAPGSNSLGPLAREPDGTLPFFTVRRPLGRGEIRRLNLFEPRWLAMMDALAEAQADGALPGARLCCVHATNRFYSPEGGGTAATERSADLLLDPSSARVARVLRAEEGVRPVTGARRLTVWLEGEDDAEVASLRPSARGYLVGELGGEARPPEGPDTGAGGAAPTPSPGPSEDARPPLVVCVVGLAHANGVLDRCAEVMVEV